MEDEEIDENLKIGFLYVFFLFLSFGLEIEEMQRKLDQLLTEDGEDIGAPLIKKMRAEKELIEEEEGDEEEEENLSPLSNISINDHKRIAWSKSLVSTLISQLSSQSSSSSSSSEDESPANQAFSQTIHSLQSKLLHMRTMVLDAYSEVGRFTKENIIMQKQLKNQIREKLGDDSSIYYSHEGVEEKKLRRASKRPYSDLQEDLLQTKKLMVMEEEDDMERDETISAASSTHPELIKSDGMIMIHKYENDKKIRILEKKIQRLEVRLIRGASINRNLQKLIELNQLIQYNALGEQFNKAMKICGSGLGLSERETMRIDDIYHGKLREFETKCEEFRHRYDEDMSNLFLGRENLYSRLDLLVRRLEPVTNYLMIFESAELESGEVIEDEQYIQAREELTSQDVFDELLDVERATYIVEDRCDQILTRIEKIELELKEMGRVLNGKANEWHNSHVTISKQQRHIENICHTNSISFDRIMETVASKFNQYQRHVSQFSYPDEIQPETDEHQSDNEGEFDEVY